MIPLAPLLVIGMRQKEACHCLRCRIPRYPNALKIGAAQAKLSAVAQTTNLIKIKAHQAEGERVYAPSVSF